MLLTRGGVTIVAVYEDAPTQASYFSADRGREDAAAAMEQAAAVGQPRGSGIYFTVDYDATSKDIQGVITDYFKGIVETIGDAYRVGVYGSGATCLAIYNGGLAKLAWLAQSTGWSGYSNFNAWAIKQGPEMVICGLNADSDIAHDDFGGFAV